MAEESENGKATKAAHQDKCKNHSLEKSRGVGVRASAGGSADRQVSSPEKPEGKERKVDLDMLVSPAMLEAARHPNKERLEESRQWWSKKYGRELTSEDAAEIHRNLFGFLKVLVEADIERHRREAGGHVPDEKKIQALRYEIRHLDKQIEATGKMIKHWSKGEPQRLALEQASKALDDQLKKKRHELQVEIDGPKKAE